MGTLTIKGDDKQLEIIAKTESGRARKYGLEMSLIKDKTQEVKKSPELTAKDVAELIAGCKTIEDLKEYESDTRQVAKAAYNKKLKELE